MQDYFSLQIGLMHYWKIVVNLDDDKFNTEWGYIFDEQPGAPNANEPVMINT